MPVEPDRLQATISAELAQRRAEVVQIDPRLAQLADLLIGFVTDGGKRLRPEFLWCGWTAADGGVDPASLTAVYQVCTALELIQACALIHDDVIDRSDSRRGKPAAHRAVEKMHADAGMIGDAEHYGLSAAILLGDLALCWADDLFAEGALAISEFRPGADARALPVWRSMRNEVLSGQLLDLVSTAAVAVDPAAQAADAMRINRYKTAAYTVERPVQLGAVLAGAGPETIAALRAFGTDVGIAFQLRDDLLGVYGDPTVTGKPAGDDLLEGKRTLLLATARAALDGELLAELDSGIGTAGADVDRLAAIIAESGAPEMLERRIAELLGSGLAALDAIDQNGGPVIGASAKTRLTRLAVLATARRF